MTRSKLLRQVAIGTSDDTEHQFYEALQQGDVEKLMAVWSDDDDIACVHPGGPRLIGASSIRASFETLFAKGGVKAHPETVRRVLTHETAVHSVLERVEVMTKEGRKSAWVVATNVYLKTPQGWRLACHHASPGTAREVREITEGASILH